MDHGSVIIITESTYYLRLHLLLRHNIVSNSDDFK